MSCLKRSSKSEKTVKRALFKKKDPLKEPAFFNFFSHHDVNRVASLLNVELVIYAATGLDARDSAFVLHDFRSLQTSTSRRQLKCFLYLTAEGQLRTLQQPLLLNSNKIFFSSATVFGFGQADTLLAIDSLVHDEKASSRPSTIALSKLRIKHITDLQQHSDFLFERWKKTVVLVSFCRLLKRGSWTAKRKFSDCYFTTLALVTSPEARSRGCTLEEMGLFDSPLVIALYNEEFVCKLTAEFSEGLLARYRDASGRKEKICGRNFMENPKISASDRLAAQKVWKEASAARKKWLNSNEQKASGRICKCSTCSSSSFSENMSAAGPEQLCSTGYSVSDLLKMLGAWTPSAERDVDKLCELSIASMDIESKTVTADVGGPSHGEPVEYRSVDTSKMEGYVKKIQKPIMIAHADSLLGSGGTAAAAAAAATTGTKIFTAESDSEPAIFKMMRKYWDFVLERQRAAQEEKLRIARPLYELVNSYRRPFFELASEWYDSTSAELREKENSLRQAGAASSDSSYLNYEADLVQGLADKLEFTLERLNAAWRQSIPGKLEEALDRLVEQYEVFSFYG